MPERRRCYGQPLRNKIWNEPTVWPDVRSRPNLYKSCPNRNHNSFYYKIMFCKMAKKLTKYLGCSLVSGYYIQPDVSKECWSVNLQFRFRHPAQEVKVGASDDDRTWPIVVNVMRVMVLTRMGVGGRRVGNDGCVWKWIPFAMNQDSKNTYLASFIIATICNYFGWLISLHLLLCLAFETIQPVVYENEA